MCEIVSDNLYHLTTFNDLANIKTITFTWSRQKIQSQHSFALLHFPSSDSSGPLFSLCITAIASLLESLFLVSSSNDVLHFCWTSLSSAVLVKLCNPCIVKLSLFTCHAVPWGFYQILLTSIYIKKTSIYSYAFKKQVPHELGMALHGPFHFEN